MHIPVLLKEVINSLNLQEGDTVVDGTINRGGHAKEICERIGKKGTLIGIDLDQEALDETKETLKDAKCKIILEKNNFRKLDKVLAKNNVDKVDAILLDLGFSSNQMDDSKRGLSFQKNEPLLMTLKDNPTEEDAERVKLISSLIYWDIIFALIDSKLEIYADSREIVEEKSSQNREGMSIQEKDEFILNFAAANFYAFSHISFFKVSPPQNHFIMMSVK